MITGSVSLRFWHPAEDLAFLSSLLALPCYRSWLSGARRQTPKGSLLPGVYKESYWVTRLEYPVKEGFGNKFVLAVKCLLKAEKEILKLIQSGGRVEVYLQLPGHINYGATIDNSNILILGNLGVDFLIEVFP